MDVFLVPDEQREGFEELLPIDLILLEPILIGAVEGKKVCGMMAVSVTKYEWHIEYIFVGEEFRHRGIATEMVQFAIMQATSVGGRNFSVEFLHHDDSEAEDGLVKFFDTFGFTDASEGGIYTIKLSDVNIKVIGGQKPDSYLIPLPRVSEKQWSSLINAIQGMADEQEEELSDDSEIEVDDEENEENFCSNIYIELLAEDMYMLDESFIYLDYNGKAQGCILMKEVEEDTQVDYLFSKGGVSGYNILCKLIAAAFSRCYIRFGAEKKIYVNVQSDKMIRFVNLITNNKAKKYAENKVYVI